jgi:hypothetical protein
LGRRVSGLQKAQKKHERHALHGGVHGMTIGLVTKKFVQWPEKDEFQAKSVVATPGLKQHSLIGKKRAKIGNGVMG